MGKMVRAAEAMDDDTLIAHVNARHVPIAGMAQVIRRESDPGEGLLRAYHAHVHRRGLDDVERRPVTHEHRAPEVDGGE